MADNRHYWWCIIVHNLFQVWITRLKLGKISRFYLNTKLFKCLFDTARVWSFSTISWKSVSKVWYISLGTKVYKSPIERQLMTKLWCRFFKSVFCSFFLNKHSNNSAWIYHGKGTQTFIRQISFYYETVGGAVIGSHFRAKKL